MVQLKGISALRVRVHKLHVLHSAPPSPLALRDRISSLVAVWHCPFIPAMRLC